MDLKFAHGLTPKQEMFCHELLKDLDPQAAAARAGYSSAGAGTALMKDPKVQRRINELQGELKYSTGITPEEILKRLMRLAHKAEDANNFAAAIKALETLGKHFAMWTDKQITEDITRKNPFSSGEKEEDYARDIQRLTRVAAPLLKVVGGTDVQPEDPADAGTPVAEAEGPPGSEG